MKRQPGKRLSGPRHGWKRAQMTSKMRAWARKFKESPRRSDWDVAYMRKMAEAALAKAEEWFARIAIYESGDWPSARHVSDTFGTWNAGLEEANLPTRAQGQRTRRGTRPSARLLRLGHAIVAAYGADRRGDDEGLAVALRQVSRVASRIAREVETA